MSELGPSRRWIIWALRLGAILLVGVGVSGTVRNALTQLSQYEWHVRPAWLALAGTLYAIGLVPMAWFWHRTLAALGQPAPWPVVLRAYFLGHVGKYLPGKAMAVILRIATVRKWVPSMRVAIVSTMLETLTMMSVGAFLAAVLAIILRLQLWQIALAATIAVGIGLPTLPPITRLLARLGARNGVGTHFQGQPVPAESVDNVENETRPHFSGLDVRLFARGWFAGGMCWLFLGWSLWATLRAMGVEARAIDDLPLMVTVVTFAVVVGFASMLPGGLGVRNALLIQLLDPICGAAGALIAAVLMRLVWIVSELSVCVILYVAAKMRRSGEPSRT